MSQFVDPARSYQTRSFHEGRLVGNEVPAIIRKKDQVQQRKLHLCEKVRIRKLLWKAHRASRAPKTEVTRAWKSVASQAGFSVADAKQQFTSVKNSLKNLINTGIAGGGTNWQEIVQIVDTKYRNSSISEFWLRLGWLAEEVAKEVLDKRNQPRRGPKTLLGKNAVIDITQEGQSVSNVNNQTNTAHQTSTAAAAATNHPASAEKTGQDGENLAGKATTGMSGPPKRPKQPRKTAHKKRGDDSEFFISSTCIPGQYETSDVLNLNQIKMENARTEEEEELHREWARAGPPGVSRSTHQSEGDFSRMSGNANIGNGYDPAYAFGEPFQNNGQHQNNPNFSCFANNEDQAWCEAAKQKLINLYIDNLGKVPADIADMVDKKVKNLVYTIFRNQNP